MENPITRLAQIYSGKLSNRDGDHVSPSSYFGAQLCLMWREVGSSLRRCFSIRSQTAMNSKSHSLMLLRKRQTPFDTWNLS